MQPMKNQQTLHVQVCEATILAAGVRMLRLRAYAPTQQLPDYTPGAHIGVSVQLQDSQKEWRQYSLIELEHRDRLTTPPESYLIAIRLDENGRGGSRYLHEGLNVGDIIDITAPRNDFPMRSTGKRVYLIAGGIGVTPLASMAAACKFHGRDVKMLYAGRERASMALINELQTLLGEHLHVHADSEAGAPVDLRALFDEFTNDDDIHICGPGALIDGMIVEAERRGWAHGRLNFELFSPPAATEGDSAFDVVLAGSDRTLHIPADKSILEVLIEQGCDPMFDCKRGECGVCSTAVISGEIDHRDYVLSERERATHSVIYPCVSRSKSAVLVLDL